ncbi:10055_t:CDS:1, partial [Racocetra persica]
IQTPNFIYTNDMQQYAALRFRGSVMFEAEKYFFESSWRFIVGR